MLPYRLRVVLDEITQRIGQGSLQPTHPLLVSRVHLRRVVWLRGGKRKDGLAQHFLQKAERPNRSPQAFPESSLVSMSGKSTGERIRIDNPTISRAIPRHNDLRSSPTCNHVLNQRPLASRVAPLAGFPRARPSPSPYGTKAAQAALGHELPVPPRMARDHLPRPLIFDSRPCRSPLGEGWTIRDHRAILRSEPYASADLGAASDVTAKSILSEAAPVSRGHDNVFAVPLLGWKIR